eukprot:CAMPEP_0113833676 /NCGR_PEP_ID=MMETSP0328-20130328/8028_1 /TAXON_ID=39455 /ORGANISM="Alexandrium minutum" /LENGTH=67 /DNA_ID=CAMNT_0000801949 /DNA_START=8 /DNA_END=208 /DNA_ORIENTATION=- /assembly_acc=CAM_ASM_000350
MPPELVDVGSSINLAGFTEILMCGIVMGVVPVTILGLMVAAWLQFKKGPTLGLEAARANVRECPAAG